MTWGSHFKKHCKIAHLFESGNDSSLPSLLLWVFKFFLLLENELVNKFIPVCFYFAKCFIFHSIPGDTGKKCVVSYLHRAYCLFHIRRVSKSFLELNSAWNTFIVHLLVVKSEWQVCIPPPPLICTPKYTCTALF